jgi:peptidoglycan/xylan/chitin deacetylase (PgdA/CDA1 family)/CelD/BcsL family acetyltransferase involved in cellulose biosynthesis
MRVFEIRQKSELRGLESGWKALLAESPSNSIFLSWEWLSAWWSAYGRAEELRLLAAFDSQEVLRGIAPLRAGTLQRYGQTVPTLSFLGDGSNDSDYLDFIVARGYESEVMEAFSAHLAWQLQQGVILQLNEIPEISPNRPFVKRLAQTGRYICQETDVPCAVVFLPSTWDSYLASLKPRFRTKVRSVLRDMEARPEVKFGFCDNVDQLARLLPTLFDLHTRRWRLDGKPGVFGWNRKRDFYFEVSPLLLRRNWLRFSWLEWNGQVLACQYGFEYEGSYLHLQEGYEPASEHLNVGIALRAWTLRGFIQKGVREYDFLAGVGRHKSDWGASTKLSKQIVIARPTWKNSAVCLGPEWKDRAKELVRKSMPAAMLTARAARQKKQQQSSAASSSSPWVRNVAANFYIHSRLPALVRPLRDQYQLSTSHRRLNKRAETTARILYYHRVNDDNDPFFPAISTRLFEEQMQYVARHYKVLSMPRLLEYLDSGAKEPALAITFDDGYQDNYLKAFPILKGLGLPLTIFLSTGSLDSREPLWFEELALALKTTTKQQLDLEIDIPRRFWLRTTEERLKANLELIGLLKLFPDGELRRLCQQILRQLEVTDCAGRKDKMLTWEQVRLMKSQGVDFGGHTVNHPFLSRLSTEQAFWEVSECKRRIEEELQAPAEYFAYPNGREEDYGKWNKEVIRKAGYRAAVTTIWGTNYRTTDPLELKRGGPWDNSLALFAYKLDWYQLVND